MYPEGNVPGYVCNPGSPRERDAASQGHTSGIPTRAMLHSWKLAPAAHNMLLSILVMTSLHLTSGCQFWLITHMIQSWTTLMAFPIASRRSISFPRGYIRNSGRFVITNCPDLWQWWIFIFGPLNVDFENPCSRMSCVICWKATLSWTCLQQRKFRFKVKKKLNMDFILTQMHRFTSEGLY